MVCGREISQASRRLGQTHLISPITDLYVHSFNGHLLSSYYVPGTLLGSGDKVVNKITPCGASMGEKGKMCVLGEPDEDKFYGDE